jgi:Fe-S cluster assembly ATP-binding protein
MNTSLIISNLAVRVNETDVLHDVSLQIAPGSTHVLMGPNGSGKSSLAHTLLGHPAYHVTGGSITYGGESLTDMPIHERAQKGLFVAFQYPVELPGVIVFTFLYESYRACVSKDIGVIEFKHLLEDTMELLGIDQAWCQRQVNVGFSGGEKKILELLQLVLLRPQIAILDEIDSGLDVDALKKIATALAIAREENPGLSLLIITHYQRILQYITPDVVHVMYRGRLVASGSSELAHTIEKQGYHDYRQPAV